MKRDASVESGSAVVEAEPAAQFHAHRLTGTRPVERQRHRGPPVHHQRVAADGRLDVAAADVEDLVSLCAEGRGVVDPAEEQRHVRVVGQRLPPPVQLLAQELGGHVVAADRGRPVGGASSHRCER